MIKSARGQLLTPEEALAEAEELNRLVDSMEKGRAEHRALMAKMEAREKLEPLSLQFVNAVKQLCKDFSDRQDRPYMGDVFSALDALLVNEGIPVSATWQVSPEAQINDAPPEIFSSDPDYAYMRGWNDCRAAGLGSSPEQEPEPFPQPRQQSTPCNECHLQPGERCDICGAKAPA
ncbi:hypothetical protein ACKI1H_27185 [Pseudomonas sp. YH-1]|uniref:hypothetical protein n=1 Tax=Pseudomonas sp. YH-1 TaxID=3384787 RepID=UPI003F7F0A7C